MPTQRTAEGPPTRGQSRRRFLSTLSGVAAAGAGLGGCLGPLGQVGGGRPEPVSVLAAGSLQRTFSEGLAEATEREIRVEAHGSVTAARLVATDRRDPDIVALADPVLFEKVLDAPWHAAFATNELVVASDDSPGGRAVAEADNWFEPILAGDAALGRTDPDHDPLGYRTLFAVALATDYYEYPGLGDELLAPSQIYPETSLLSRFETGGLDAAVVYRNMAVERGYDYRSLPPEIDLGDPSMDDHYAGATYTLSDGTTVAGGNINYGVTARSESDRVRDVYDRLVRGSYLRQHGFGRPDAFPRYHGAVPDSIHR